MNRLHHLDALRGLAAICVVGYHFFIYYGGSEIFSAGYLAVDFFFALSGFVMSACYDGRLAQGLAPREFLRRRLRRLWPAAAIGTLLGFGVFAMSGVPQWSDVTDLLRGLVLWPDFSTRSLFVFNVVVWSLFFELIANILHALWFRRISTPLLIVIGLFSLAYLSLSASVHGSLDLGPNPETFLGGVARVLVSYTMGMVLFRTARLPRFYPYATWIVLPAALLLASFAHDAISVSLLFICVVSPLIIAVAARPIKVGSMRGVAEGLGALSYPLYAIHVPIIMLARELQLSTPAAILAIAAVAILTAFATEPGVAEKLRRTFSRASDGQACQTQMPPI